MSSDKKKFLLNLAIGGSESTGKSTVVNALCCGKYTQAAHGRTTEGVNKFIVHEVPKSPDVNASPDSELSDSNNKKRTLPQDCSNGVPLRTKKMRLPDNIYQKIEENNKTLRGAAPGKDIENSQRFNVNVKTLPFSLREGTRLAIIETPGLNENNQANVDSRAYFKNNWNAIDVLVFVMDAKQGADYNDQIENLHFFKKLHDEKGTPIFILCNKIDDPENMTPEEVHKLEDARKKVEEIFGVSCRKKALVELLESQYDVTKRSNDLYPVFLPVSAKTAFTVRAGSSSNIDLSRFREMIDTEYIYPIGRAEFGKEWTKMKLDDQSKNVYELLQTPAPRDELLKQSGFKTALQAMEFCIGGEDAQLELIKHSAFVGLQKTDFANKDLLHNNLRNIHRKLEFIGEETSLQTKFWELYPQWQKEAFDSFRSECSFEKLAFPAKQLITYRMFCQGVGWKDEVQKADKEMKAIIQAMFEIIQSHTKDWSLDQYLKKPENEDALGWNNFSPADWQILMSSILVGDYSKGIRVNFSSEIISMEKSKMDFQRFFPCYCTACGENGVYLNTRAKSYSGNIEDEVFKLPQFDVNVKIPLSLQEPNHPGHIVWLFGEHVDYFVA